MKTPKKIGKAIAKKFKNWRGTTASKETATYRTQEPSASIANPDKISPSTGRQNQ